MRQHYKKIALSILPLALTLASCGKNEVADAINMFTINGAWMNNLENERGSIEVGKYADFILADKDPFAQGSDDVWKVQLTNTFFEGKEVFKKN